MRNRTPKMIRVLFLWSWDRSYIKKPDDWDIQNRDLKGKRYTDYIFCYKTNTTGRPDFMSFCEQFQDRTIDDKHNFVELTEEELAELILKYA